MRVTFLGHQGWQIENGGRSFLLDPILEAMGNGAVTLPVWPRRRLDFRKFEPLEAVIISHEHADHFSLETLAALPRRCPIYVSDLSSYAMSTAIAELGFEVLRFSALRGFGICGLKVTALPGLYNTLEPDTYALLIEDGSGASFLTGIDTVVYPDVLAWLAQHCPERTLDNLTNNFVEPRQPLVDDTLAYTRSRSIVVGNMVDFVEKLQPRRAVVSGQGWCFEGSKSKLNHSFFSVDNHWLTDAARELAPHVDWFEGVPGMRFSLNGDQMTIDRSPMVGELQYPSRAFDPQSVQEPEPLGPWSEVTELPPDRLREVRDFIGRELGRAMGAHAPNLMQRLYYLKFQGARYAASTFGVVIRNGASRCLFELDYGHLTFGELGPNASRTAAVGLEIWASDLELLIRAQEDAYMIMESAVRTWSHAPDIIEVSMLLEAFLWFTPRFRPDEFLRFYRTRIAELRAEPAARQA